MSNRDSERTVPLPRLPLRAIGNYELTELVAEGSTAFVYLARNPGLQRLAAIKVLRSSLAGDPGAVARFLTEARIAATLRHPHVVEILDCGVLGDGSPYIVMEFLEGETLARRLRRGPVSVARATEILRQAATALAAAHAAGVVHRDLKPDNIYLCPEAGDPPKPRVKVLDFGVAKFLRRMDGAPEARGALLGTPLYMSPEQCRGEVDIDARSDVYALGVVGYELLAGRPPFEASQPGAVIEMHITQAPPPLRAARPQVPVELEALIMRMLAKSPQARPASMNEVVEALEGIGEAPATDPAVATLLRAPAPVATPPPAPEARPARVRTWILAVGAAEVLFGGALIAYAIRLRRSQQAPAAGGVEVTLESEPPGATVTIDGRVVGVTPTVVRPSASDRSAEIVFSLAGHRPEVIHAVLVAGLKLRASLKPR